MKIKSILVLRNDRFGEFLLCIPAIRALRLTFSEAKIIIVVNPYVRELVEAIPEVDEVIEWPCTKHGILENFKMVYCLRRKKIDMAVMLNPSKEFNIFAFLAGIPIRVGYDRKCGFLLTLKMKDKKYLGEKHEVEYNLDLVRLVGAQTKDLSLSLKIENNIVNNSGTDITLDSSARLVAIHPWTSDPVKQWPLENFRELAKKTAQYSDCKVIIIGGPDVPKESKEYFDNLDENLINVTGRTSLMQLGALLKKCKLLISADSGPVHLASAVGTPVLALFRNDIPGKCAKRWGPWGKGHMVIEKKSLLDIKTEEVFDKFKEMINK